MSLFTPQTPARRCPRCSAQWLWGYRYRQQELDVCRACGGLWFDRGEVNGLLRQLHPEQAPECFTETFGASLGPADIHCPDCAIPLERHHLLLNYHSEIDICGRCEGSWIDKDELPQLEQSPALQQHLDDINQGISWKTFLFQIFSQLPVEYNIKPKRTPWVNYVLLLANLIIFMAYYFYPPNYDY
ncbi:MAG: zf-TFIIB domain-containing protein, partial [Cellvibrionaceae bacterium]|nr:zf-TFIIB domain-containing protein [Cellvibrionaceae bacterium]